MNIDEDVEMKSDDISSEEEVEDLQEEKSELVVP